MNIIKDKVNLCQTGGYSHMVILPKKWVKQQQNKRIAMIIDDEGRLILEGHVP